MNQRELRAKIARLERLQAIRVEAVERRKKELDAVLEGKQRELDNLRAQVTIGAVR